MEEEEAEEEEEEEEDEEDDDDDEEVVSTVVPTTKCVDMGMSSAFVPTEQLGMVSKAFFNVSFWDRFNELCMRCTLFHCVSGVVVEPSVNASCKYTQRSKINKSQCPGNIILYQE